MGNNHLSDKIAWLLQQPGVTAAALVAATDSSGPSTVSEWKRTGRISKPKLLKIAELSGQSLEWWINPDSPVPPTAPGRPGLGTLLKAKLHPAASVANVTDGPPLRGRVPLISWTTAGMWADVEDPHPPGNGDEWIMTTANVGPHAFALRVQGDSMEPKVPDGSIVIIDPDRGHHHGSIVLAKRTSDQQATLKQLWYDGATPKLRPLNERYDILDMPPDTRIIGVAVKLELDL